MVNKAAILVIISLVTVPIAKGLDEPRVDPETGSIRLLFIGDSFMKPGFPTPYYSDDPRIDVTPVPSEIAILGGDALAFRYYRMYLPRTEEFLKERYDEVIIADAQSHHLKSQVQFWIRNSVVDGGLGFMMVDGPASFGGKDGGWGLSPSWGPTPVGGILPVDCSEDRQGWSLSKVYRLVPKDPEHPLFRGKPWNQVFFYAHNRVLDRDGAEVIATMDNNPTGSPLIATWDPGRGRSVALVFDWGGNGVTDFYRWKYAPDFLAHVAYFPSRLPIPEDMELDHVVRISLANYRERRLYVISVIEFSEKFGASTARLYDELNEIDTDKGVADLYFKRVELPEAMEEIDVILGRISELGEEAIRAKDRALMWIYIVEWCAVSGTAMVAGSILYALMIKRRLYREVRVTRTA
jgi:uncharacterized membrane protein